LPDVIAFYASPLDRAATTARIIGEAIGHPPVLLPDLAETNVGDGANLTIAEFQARFPEIALMRMIEAGGLDIRWPGGETGREVRDRVLATYTTIIDRHRHQAGTVLVVSHGGPLSWITAQVRRESLEQWPVQHDVMGNCSICELTVPLDPMAPAAFLRWDDRAHLAPLAPAEHP
jgi:broad specificity phosphatase PhoE